MTRYVLALALLAATASPAQQEGPATTQTLISLESNTPAAPTSANLTVKVDNKAVQLAAVDPVPPTGVQIALLIDDGLRTSVGREIGSLRDFLQGLPPAAEVFVGYMQNGRVAPAQGFTTDHAAAAAALRIPLSSPGISASPYFCLSDFVKNWPSDENRLARQTVAPARKARIVLMLTNGVDPYNGSTSILNQNSPYVDTAVHDAQRAGIPVYSIYFSDAGFGGGGGFGGRGARASFSGQSYLQQVAEGTGGTAFYQGTGSPVSLAPFLKRFQEAVANTYLLTFPASSRRDFVNLKVNTNLPHTRVHAAAQVRPGTRLSNTQAPPA